MAFDALTVALQINRLVAPLTREIAQHDPDMARQIRRAAQSIPANLAELLRWMNDRNAEINSGDFDITDLPVYGPHVRDTRGVFSWNYTQAIVAKVNGDGFDIVPRCRDCGEVLKCWTGCEVEQ